MTMNKPGEMGLRSWVGRLAVTYLEKVPPHRGQARLIDVLGQRLGPIPMRCAGDAQLLLRLDSMMDRSYVVRDRLDHPDLMNALAELSNGDIFIDVGANAGLYTILASDAVGPHGRVLAFEPSRDEFLRLAWAIWANRATNVQAFNFALSDSSGFVGFVPSPDSHTGLHHLSGSADVCSERVWTQRGDATVKLAPRERVALLKIDVEGAEMLVLRGFHHLFEAGQIERLVVEVTDEYLRRFGSSAAELYAYLAEMGYEGTKGLLSAWQYDDVFVRRPNQPCT
jgi:FkbM family methyltransferase